MATPTKRTVVWVLLAMDTTAAVYLLVLTVVAAGRGVRGASVPDSVALVFMAMSFVVVGGLLALRRPGNAVGWLLLAVGTVWTVPLASVITGEALLGVHAGGSAAAWLAWPGVWLWIPPLGLMGTQVLLRFPDGALPSRRWRWFSRLSIVLIALATTGMAITPPTDADGHANLTHLPWVPPVATLAAALAALACFPVSVASVVARYRRAGAVEREQIRWVAWAAGVFVGVYMLGLMPFLPLTFTENQVIPFLAYSLVPVAIGFAILRYRLYDIDRIVSRTVSYALVTAMLAGVYVGSVALLTGVLPFPGEAGTAASVLAAAALFTPLRRRVQRAVDRRFNRVRYDSEAVVAAFAQRMREQVAIETVHADLARTVDQTLGPAHYSLWLRGEP
jgi:cytochrome b subunit of formate dehydrogenase